MSRQREAARAPARGAAELKVLAAIGRRGPPGRAAHTFSLLPQYTASVINYLSIPPQFTASVYRLSHLLPEYTATVYCLSVPPQSSTTSVYRLSHLLPQYTASVNPLP